MLCKIFCCHWSYFLFASFYARGFERAYSNYSSTMFDFLFFLKSFSFCVSVYVILLPLCFFISSLPLYYSVQTFYKEASVILSSPQMQVLSFCVYPSICRSIFLPTSRYLSLCLPLSLFLFSISLIELAFLQEHVNCEPFFHCM